MLKIRWIWQFASFMVLGILALYVIGSNGSSGAKALILSAPLAGLLLLAAFRHAAGSVARLIKSFTWWQGLWLLLFLSDLVLRQRTDTQIRESAIDAEAIYRIALVAMTAAVLAVRLALKKPAWLGSLSPGLVGALACYAGISLISTLWSVFPLWTLYKSLEYLVDVALLAAILVEVRSVEGFVRLFNWTWALYGLLLASVWLGVFLWPGDAIMTGVGTLGVQLYGVMPQVHANGVGTLGAIMAIVALTRLLLPGGKPGGGAWYLLLFLIGFSSLILSQTRSAMAGFLLGALLVLVLSKRVSTISVLAVSVTGLLSLGGLGSVVWSYLLRGQSDQNLQTLSGRLNWWQFAWEKFWERPLTGYGAFAGGRFVVLNQVADATTASMHSDYVEALVGASLWAVIPLVIALLGTWLWLTRAVRDPTLEPLERYLALEGIGVLAVITVRSFFTTMLTWHAPLLMFAVLGYAEFLRRRLKYLTSPAGSSRSWIRYGTAGLGQLQSSSRQ